MGLQPPTCPSCCRWEQFDKKYLSQLLMRKSAYKLRDEIWDVYYKLNIRDAISFVDQVGVCGGSWVPLDEVLGTPPAHLYHSPRVATCCQLPSWHCLPCPAARPCQSRQSQTCCECEHPSTSQPLGSIPWLHHPRDGLDPLGLDGSIGMVWIHKDGHDPLGWARSVVVGWVHWGGLDPSGRA